MSSALRPGARSAVFEHVAGWLAPGGWDAPAAAAETDWPAAIELSSHHLVAPALAWRMLRAKDIDARVADYLEAVLFLNAERNAKLLEGLAGAVRLLNSAEIIPQAIKGAGLLAGGIYPHPGMRVIGDLDLLVPQSRLDAARDVLARGGFLPADDPLDRPERHQLPMMIHRDTGIGIELHRHPVTRALAPLADAAELLSRGVPIAIEGAAITLPDPTDRVVLAIAHGQIKDGGHRRGVPSLRALLDLALHQHRFARAIDWEAADRRFDAVGMRALFHDTLALSHALMGAEPSLALMPQSGEAIARLRSTLDRSPRRRALHALAGLLRAAPSVLGRRPSEQLAALSLARWRQRIARHHPRW